MTVRSFAAVCLLALGVLVVVIAAVGMFRFRRTLELLQASALADTLGLLLILAGLALLCGFTVHTAKLVLLAVILWAVNPWSAHLIARWRSSTGLGMEPEHLMGEGERSCDRIGTSAAVVFDLLRRGHGAVPAAGFGGHHFYVLLRGHVHFMVFAGVAGSGHYRGRRGRGSDQPAVFPHAAEDQCPERNGTG